MRNRTKHTESLFWPSRILLKRGTYLYIFFSFWLSHTFVWWTERNVRTVSNVLTVRNCQLCQRLVLRSVRTVGQNCGPNQCGCIGHVWRPKPFSKTIKRTKSAPSYMTYYPLICYNVFGWDKNVFEFVLINNLLWKSNKGSRRTGECMYVSQTDELKYKLHANNLL